MKRPLVSILIPVKNGIPFLEECLDSIIKQDFPDWEVLIVDDHSNDDTWSKLISKSNIDPRIKPIKNIDHGIIAALRLAYAKSLGQFITRMDADDIMCQGKLNFHAVQLEKHGVGHISIGHVKYIKEGGEVGGGYRRYETWLNKLTTTGSNFNEIYKECVIPSPNWMMHRSDLDAIGAFEPDTYPEDYDLCFRMYAAKFQVIPNETLTLQWRDHDKRTSRNDEKYSDNRFLSIKLHYFLQLEYQEDVPLYVWGAGKKGKIIAQYLRSKNIRFTWISDNPRKVGHIIYDNKVQPTSNFFQENKAISILAVANPQQQKEILSRTVKNLNTKELNIIPFS